MEIHSNKVTADNVYINCLFSEPAISISQPAFRTSHQSLEITVYFFG